MDYAAIVTHDPVQRIEVVEPITGSTPEVVRSLALFADIFIAPLLLFRCQELRSSKSIRGSFRTMLWRQFSASESLRYFCSKPFWLFYAA